MFEETLQLEFDEQIMRDRFSLSLINGMWLHDNHTGERFDVETVDDAVSMVNEIIEEGA